MLDEPSAEAAIQAYLERHPWCVARDLQLVPSIVITQFPLGADYRPDFVCFWRNSAGNFMRLIEIEPPALEIFTKSDEFSAAFNHGVQQLEDWNSWCARSSDLIERMLEPLTDEFTTEVPSFDRVELVLVAGRRSQLSTKNRQRRWRERLSRLPRNTVVRTYDGFVESLKTAAPLDHYIQCLRYSGQSYGLAHPDEA